MKWQVNLKVTIFTIFFFPLFVFLGFWQLDRAAYKIDLMEQKEKDGSTSAIPFSQAVNSISSASIPVIAEGTFYKHRYWLLENQWYQRRLGYHVIHPFKTDHGIVLVNRGWVPRGQYRLDNPDIDVPLERIVVTGKWLKPVDSPFIKQKILEQHVWPSRILEIDTYRMSQQFGDTLLDNIIKINFYDPVAYPFEINISMMGPEKHRGYAVQWFLMSITLLFAWLFTNSNLGRVIKLSRPAPNSEEL